MRNLRDRLGRELLILDGAMGTMLQSRGLALGELPERMNLTAPAVVREVHAAYLAAGADILETNTFGANRLKYGNDLASVVSSGVRAAREAIADSGRDAYVAASIGPLGKLLKPMGDLPFEGAYSLFREIAACALNAGADALLFETFTDLYELKAALLAAKDACALPVIATMTFDETGRLLTGADVVAAATVAESLGADAVGFNCGLGPKQLLEFLPALVGTVSVPIAVNPNAGLPVIVNGRAEFHVSPEEFAPDSKKLAEGGASLLGGCCGTTPEHIRALKNALQGFRPSYPVKKRRTIATSYAQFAEFGRAPVLIGERINPTGKPDLKRALRENDMGYILREGARQADAGADALDVNVGLPGIDERELLPRAVEELQSVLPTPLMIDTANAEAMERAARLYNGRPILNSVNGKQSSMDAIFPIARRYGALVVALTLDEDGIPATAEGRVKIAEKILAGAETYGLGREDLIFDALAMSVSTGGGALAALGALDEIRHRIGANTSLGISNVSFGLPARGKLNAAFFAAALARGLSAGIINPLDRELMDAVHCHNVLTGLDADCSKYVARFADAAKAEPAAPAAQMPLREAGLQDAARAAAGREMSAGRAPMALIEEELVPALNEVGEGFEKKTVFLPQLLMSADAAKAAFEVVRAKIAAAGAERLSRGRIVIATVRGDIHDIGKNIVRALLENYGYTVTDLGRDVAPEMVVEATLREGAPLVGLSALMTTTVESMEETIRLLKLSTPAKIMVGGAVLTEDYARKIGADFYARDAMAAVRIAGGVFS